MNMRQGPSSSTKKLARLPKGTEVTIYANENGWCLVEYKGTRATYTRSTSRSLYTIRARP
ncbi:MAG: SH3 domain-containing protein [Christensenellales bacterium]